MTDIFYGFNQCAGQILRAGPVTLQQMKRHTLRRLGPNAGQTFKRIDELLQ